MRNEWTDDDKKTVQNMPPVFGTPADEPLNPAVPTRLNNTPIRSTPTYYNDGLRPPMPPSPARERMRRRRVRSRSNEWAWVIIAGSLLSVVVLMSMSVFLLLRASQQKVPVMPTAVIDIPTPVDARGSGKSGTLVTGQRVTLEDGRSITLTPWDGKSRFTVVLVGLDRRPNETGLSYRTDTMMLISIDPNSRKIGVLSIPRDLFVEVPGYSELQRINTPLVLGELRQIGFGPQLMMQTVQYNLGIRVHEYIAVDFNTFTTLVDAIGGVDINVPYNINDPFYPDMNYGYDPFVIKAGQQHLDGKTALKYARTRHGDNDFQRAERQQQVIYAIRERILNLNMLPQLIIQAPTLWSKLSDNVSTGLTLDQAIQLAWYLKDIPSKNIHTGIIDANYTSNYTTKQGAAVLVPDRAKLGPLMVQVFGDNYSQ
jgi:LCP family protein required for cell wall assembly